MNGTISITFALELAGWIFAAGCLAGGWGYRTGHNRMMRKHANDPQFWEERRKHWQSLFSRDRDNGSHGH